jgi:hypothetical protein
MKRWHVVLIVTVVAAIGIQAFNSNYGQMQTAKTVQDFLNGLNGHPGRAAAATLCDIVFAAGYTTLGIIGFRTVGRSAASLFAVVTIVFGGVLDEIENVVLLIKNAARDTLTKGWFDASRAFQLKWIGTFGFLTLFYLLFKRWRAR